MSDDFDVFKSGNVFKLCTLDTLRPVVLQAPGLLDGITEGEKAVHSNCIAHTHIHVHKIGTVTGTLSNKEVLPYAKKWLKIIDEHNKVRTVAHTQHAHLCCWGYSIRPMYACQYRIWAMCPRLYSIGPMYDTEYSISPNVCDSALPAIQH